MGFPRPRNSSSNPSVPIRSCLYFEIQFRRIRDAPSACSSGRWEHLQRSPSLSICWYFLNTNQSFCWLWSRLRACFDNPTRVACFHVSKSRQQRNKGTGRGAATQNYLLLTPWPFNLSVSDKVLNTQFWMNSAWWWKQIYNDLTERTDKRAITSFRGLMVSSRSSTCGGLYYKHQFCFFTWIMILRF